MVRTLFLTLLSCFTFFVLGQNNDTTFRPVFLKNNGNFLTYLQKNIDYPQEAMDNCKSGTIYVKFNVGSSGNVFNVSSIYPGDSILISNSIEFVKSTSGMWKFPDNLVDTISQDTVPVAYHIYGDCLNFEHYLQKGNKYFEKNKYEKACNSFKRALYYDPLNYGAVYNCAISYLKLEVDDSACFYFERIKYNGEVIKLMNTFCN